MRIKMSLASLQTDRQTAVCSMLAANCIVREDLVDGCVGKSTDKLH